MKKLLFLGILFLSQTLIAQIPYGSNTKVGKRVQVGDISMYYEIYGKGEPLILLHGGYGSSEMMGGMIEAFSKKYQVIAVDSRSQGRTTDSSPEDTTELGAGDISGMTIVPGLHKWSSNVLINVIIFFLYKFFAKLYFPK